MIRQGQTTPRTGRRPKPHRRSTRTPEPISPRYLSLRQPTLTENIRRFRVIHRSAVLQKLEESERAGVNSL